LVTTLLISQLPEIVLLDVFAVSVPRMAWAVVVLIAGLWIAGRYVVALRPLERYYAVMTVLAVMLAVIPAIFTSAAWQSGDPRSASTVKASRGRGRVAPRRSGS
jgi:hypothetical protein